MFKYPYEVIHLLDKEQRRKLPALILLFFGLSLLDLLGISLVGPYVSLVIDSSALDGTLGQIVEIVGLPSERELVLISLGLFLVGVFLMKAVSAIWINRTIIIFSQRQQVWLRSYLMKAYQAQPYTKYLLRNSSEYIYCIEQLAGRVQAVTLLLLRIISDVIVALLIMSMLAMQNMAALALLIALLGAAVFVYDRLFRKKMREYGQKSNVAGAIMVKAIHEGIEGLKEIRILKVILDVVIIVIINAAAVWYFKLRGILRKPGIIRKIITIAIIEEMFAMCVEESRMIRCFII